MCNVYVCVFLCAQGRRVGGFAEGAPLCLFVSGLAVFSLFAIFVSLLGICIENLEHVALPHSLVGVL